MPSDTRGAKKGRPTPKEITTFAREYIRSYIDMVDEKAPDNPPPIAQQAPFHIEICLLLNGCYAMILESAPEMRIRASIRSWEELQDLVIKGVDFFLGFYPHEMKTIADWKNRGRKDALRDIRVLGESRLGKAAGKLSAVIDEISRMAATNPWLDEKVNEQIQMLRDIEERLRRGFAPVDAIATLQELKSYRPTYDKMVIDFPDKALLEKILNGVEELITIQGKMDTLENRMFEVERVSTMKSQEAELPDMKGRLRNLEEHLEKVSNILHMLNIKVENYFSKSAEADKQVNLEKEMKDMMMRVDSSIEMISEIQAKHDTLGSNIDTDVSRMQEDIEKALKRVKRLERHFVDLAKSFEEQ